MNKTEYPIEAKLYSAFKLNPVKVSDMTDMNGIVEILRSQYASDEEIIQIMNKQAEYRKRFFNDDVNVEHILNNNPY